MFGLDILPLIKAFGYVGIFSAILLENSIPILFFVPGDTLLLTAGFLASQGYLDIEILLIGGFLSAILGYVAGYHLGHRVGTKVFRQGNSRYIKAEHLEKTKEFYNKYGSLSILIARFLPLRACVVFIAGAVHMPYRIFMTYNILSAFAWAVILPLVGYYLGQLIPVEELKKLTLIPIAGIVFMAVLVPVLIHTVKKRSNNAQEKQKL